MELHEKVRALPDRSGVYLFQDAAGAVLYIGKALSLRKRVQTYFSDREVHATRIAAMVGQIADVEFILTDTELEALILESNLIKERRPKYNIILKDDKHYPFLRLDVTDAYPMVQVARRIQDDGALYFGPYVPATAMWNVLALVNKTFQLRKCPSIKGRGLCLEYHLGRCLGPCEGLVFGSARVPAVDAAALAKGDRMLHERDAAALDRPSHERLRPVLHRGERRERVPERAEVVPADLGSHPFEGLRVADARSEKIARHFAAKRRGDEAAAKSQPREGSPEKIVPALGATVNVVASTRFGRLQVTGM